MFVYKKFHSAIVAINGFCHTLTAALAPTIISAAFAGCIFFSWFSKKVAFNHGFKGFSQGLLG